MRTWVFAFGIVLLLFGSVLMAVSNASVYGKSVIVEYAGRDKPEAWEISANFTKSEYVFVDFREDPTWLDPPNFEFNDYFDNWEAVFIEIVSPNGNSTSFAAMVKINIERLSVEGFIVTTVLESGGGLIVSTLSEHGGMPASFWNYTFGGTPVEDIGGIVECDGLYTVKIDPPYGGMHPTGNEEPPAYLSLSKKPLEHPYFYFLPVGAALTVSGVALAVWGKKSKKKG